MLEKIITRGDVNSLGVDTTALGTIRANRCLTRMNVTSAQKRGMLVNFANKDSYKPQQLVKKADISKRDNVYFSGSWGAGSVGYVISSTSDSSALQGTLYLEDMEISIYRDTELSEQMNFPCPDVQVTAFIFRLGNGTYTTLHVDDMHDIIYVRGGESSFVFEANLLGPEFNTSGGTLQENDKVYLSDIILETEDLEDNDDPEKIWGYKYIAQA